ncbi:MULTISPECIES: GGDEF domain-containing protein [unclassified Iodobacter]|uniref:GGDEF domain-containing protein n=1 Tax=unclassified Iodobacter TaxID=235634 RepID=UPI0025E090FC|nr:MULTISPECIES: diguanylate cyclase [unclassified Iodobacter]MDW5415872.1 diguanylate cyclase [Iodobacter sp. CM08]
MQQRLCDFIVNEVGVGIFSLDREYRILLWNRFMAQHSGISAEQAIGANLFELFPELPQKWLSKKIESVFVLKNFAFTSWEQRPYLFKFPHNRPITGGMDFMQQNTTFMPVRNESGEVDAVTVNLFDVTDNAIAQNLLQEAMGKLEEYSNRDGLTGIYNRRYLDTRFTQELERMSRYQAAFFTVILFDLDRFKQVNDNYGHVAGDEVLRVVASRVLTTLRDTDIFGRYGGEEFMLLLPQTDLAGAEIAAERIRVILCDQPVQFGETKIIISASLGLSECHSGAAEPQKVIEEADMALYFSKQNGRNRVTVYSPEINS